jgi:ketosteroid isomerase-like protein
MAHVKRKRNELGDSDARKQSEDICHLFQYAMADGDLKSVLSLYDPEAVFVNQSGEVTKGAHELKQKLAPLAMMKTALT